MSVRLPRANHFSIAVEDLSRRCLNNNLLVAMILLRVNDLV